MNRPSRRTRKKLKNTKRTGERSEAAFLHKASQLGALRLHPRQWTRLLRVPIKATDCLRAQAYETRATYTVGKGRAVYGANDIDFLVAHIATLNVWYVLPVRACMPAPMLRFYPHRKAKKMRLEKYREAWHLMKPGIITALSS